MEEWIAQLQHSSQRCIVVRSRRTMVSSSRRASFHHTSKVRSLAIGVAIATHGACACFRPRCNITLQECNACTGLVSTFASWHTPSCKPEDHLMLHDRV